MHSRYFESASTNGEIDGFWKSWAGERYKDMFVSFRQSLTFPTVGYADQNDESYVDVCVVCMMIDDLSCYIHDHE